MRTFILLCALLCAAAGSAGIERAHAQGADLNRGPLNALRRDDLYCGRGWRFPVLIWGERPVSVCMLRTRQRNRFGGDFGF